MYALKAILYYQKEAMYMIPLLQLNLDKLWIL